MDDQLLEQVKPLWDMLPSPTTIQVTVWEDPDGPVEKDRYQVVVWHVDPDGDKSTHQGAGKTVEEAVTNCMASKVNNLMTQRQVGMYWAARERAQAVAWLRAHYDAGAADALERGEHLHMKV